jgi:cAMP phosphodiesterase
MGYIISDGDGAVAITGDTAETDEIWSELNNKEDLRALLVECAFPDRLADLAAVSHHLTPSKLKNELGKLSDPGCEIYVINMKPMYREEIIDEIGRLGDERIRILEVGKTYDW